MNRDVSRDFTSRAVLSKPTTGRNRRDMTSLSSKSAKIAEKSRVIERTVTWFDRHQWCAIGTLPALFFGLQGLLLTRIVALSLRSIVVLIGFCNLTDVFLAEVFHGGCMYHEGILACIILQITMQRSSAGYSLLCPHPNVHQRDL